MSSYRDSPVNVNDKHPSQQVPGQGVDVCGDLILTGFDFGEEGPHVLVVEREPSGEESIENYTTAPNVGRIAHILVAPDDLGTRIVRATTAGFELKSGRREGGHPPIGQFYQRRVDRMYQNIFRFEVAMYDRKGVGVVEAVDNLLEKSQGIDRRESTTVDEVIEKLATLDVFEYQIKVVFAFKDIVYTQYVGMVHELHHDDLLVDSKALLLRFREVGSQRCARVHERLEGEDFDSGELTCATVFGDANAPAGPFADAFTNNPLANVLWVLGKVEGAGTSGRLFLLPASSQVGVVFDGGCPGRGVGHGWHCGLVCGDGRTGQPGGRVERARWKRASWIVDGNSAFGTRAIGITHHI